MLPLLGFILTISLLVFVHEFGHYYVAKIFGVKIEEFSIGFGKELFAKIDKDGVRWKICALPFGGYVKIYGFDPATIKDLKIEDKRLTFLSKALWRQFLIIAAGPIANYLLAILILTNIYFFHGQIEIPAIIGEVVVGSPAENSGLQKNDKIIMVNNNQINNFTDLQRNIIINGNKPSRFLIERNSEIIDINITPKQNPKELGKQSKITKPYIGIIAKNEPIYLKMNIFQSLWQSSKEVIYISNLILESFGQMITGTRSLDEIGGPLTIAKESGKSLEQGIGGFALFIAMISINLGLLNLLPIPVLDGGHLLFIIYQAITNKPVNQSVKNIILRLGVCMIIFLIVISISNDIKNLLF